MGAGCRLNNPVDPLVLAKLKKVGIRPSGLSSDEMFLRRVFLDVIGTLPTSEEARQFLADKSPDKRSKLIDSLLEAGGLAVQDVRRWDKGKVWKRLFPFHLAYHFVYVCG